MEFLEWPWEIGLAAGSVLTLVAVCGGIRLLRERDDFQRASDPQLPTPIRVGAILKLTRPGIPFVGRWRREQVPLLLDDLRMYDRSPVIREMADAALRCLPGGMKRGGLPK